MEKIVKKSLDCFDFADQIEEDVNLWVTDPPYPFDNTNGKNRFKYVDGVDGMYKRLTYSELTKFYKKMYDKSAEGAGAYVFCNRDGLFFTKDGLEKSGWTFRNILVWDKKSIGMGYHWRNQVEYIIYVSKGKPSKFVVKKGNLFSYRKPTGTHLSAKPKEIWEDILLQASGENFVVADPFAGTDPLSQALINNPSLCQKIKKSYSNIFIENTESEENV